MKYELHRFCLAFRRANSQELAEIVTNMQSYGYDKEQAITLYEDKILDGSARQDAAERATVEPTYTTFTGSEDEAIAFVIRRNKVRKHLTKGELDLAAAALVTAKQGAPIGNQNRSYGTSNPSDQRGLNNSAAKTRAIVAEATGRNIKTIEKARTLCKQAAPNVLDMVKCGEISTDYAYNSIIGISKEEQAQMTVTDIRKRGAERRAKYNKDKPGKPAKLPPTQKQISSWRTTKLSQLDVGTERIEGQPVLLQPAYVQRLTEASIRVNGIVGRVEGCAGMLLDIFDADVKNLLAHVPVKGKTNGEQRDYASETKKRLATLTKNIDAAIDRLTELRIRINHRQMEQANA